MPTRRRPQPESVQATTPRSSLTRRLGRGLTFGIAAGAAGTTALNGTTYLDMAIRGRPGSSTPEAVVEKLTASVGVPVPGGENARQNRLQGLGPLSGLAVGLGVGGVLGAARAMGIRPGLLPLGVAAGAAAMLATDIPITLLGLSDPRAWRARDWISDAVPHLVYGLTTAAVAQALDRDGR